MPRKGRRKSLLTRRGEWPTHLKGVGEMQGLDRLDRGKLKMNHPTSHKLLKLCILYIVGKMGNIYIYIEK